MNAEQVTQTVWLYVMRAASGAEEWPHDRVHLAWDVARESREDGTHSLRTVLHTQRLGVSESTAKRYRRVMRDEGWFSVRSQGGNGKGGTKFDLTVPAGWVHMIPNAQQNLASVEAERMRQAKTSGARNAVTGEQHAEHFAPRSLEHLPNEQGTSPEPGRGPLVGATVAYDSGESGVSHRPVVGQSQATAERESGPRLSPESLVPKDIRSPEATAIPDDFTPNTRHEAEAASNGVTNLPAFVAAFTEWATDTDERRSNWNRTLGGALKAYGNNRLETEYAGIEYNQ